MHNISISLSLVYTWRVTFVLENLMEVVNRLALYTMVKVVENNGNSHGTIPT